MADTSNLQGIVNLIGGGEYSPIVKTVGGMPQVTWQPTGMQMTTPQYVSDVGVSPFSQLMSKYNITEEQARGLQQMAGGVKSPSFQTGVEAISTPPPLMATNVQAGMEDIGQRVKGAVGEKVSAAPPVTYSLAGTDVTPTWLRTSDIETPRKKAESQVEQMNIQEQARQQQMQDYVGSMQQLIEQLSSPQTAKAISQAMVADFAVDALKEATAGTGVDISDFVKSATQAVTQTQDYLKNVSSTLKSVLDLDVDFNQLLMVTGMWKNISSFGSATGGA